MLIARESNGKLRLESYSNWFSNDDYLQIEISIGLLKVQSCHVWSSHRGGPSSRHATIHQPRVWYVHRSSMYVGVPLLIIYHHHHHHHGSLWKLWVPSTTLVIKSRGKTLTVRKALWYNPCSCWLESTLSWCQGLKTIITLSWSCLYIAPLSSAVILHWSFLLFQL